MQSVTLSDPPTDALAAIDARMRLRRSAWGAAAAPLVAAVLAFVTASSRAMSVVMLLLPIRMDASRSCGRAPP